MYQNQNMQWSNWHQHQSQWVDDHITEVHNHIILNNNAHPILNDNDWNDSNNQIECCDGDDDNTHHSDNNESPDDDSHCDNHHQNDIAPMTSNKIEKDSMM